MQAIAIARSWIARPVESKIVISSADSPPGRLAGEHRAELSHVFARDQAGLDGVRRGRPSGSPAPSRRRTGACASVPLAAGGAACSARELCGGDLRLPGAVGAHQAHVLARGERAVVEEHLRGRASPSPRCPPRAPPRARPPPLAPRSSAARARPLGIEVPDRDLPAAREERPRRGAAVDARADHGGRPRVVPGERLGGENGSRAGSQRRHGTRVEDRLAARPSRRSRAARARTPSAARAPGCRGTTSPTSAERVRRRAPASPGNRLPGNS